MTCTKVIFRRIYENRLIPIQFLRINVAGKLAQPTNVTFEGFT